MVSAQAKNTKAKNTKPVVNMSTVTPRDPAFLVGEVGWEWDHSGAG